MARRLEETEVGHVPGEGEARAGGTAAPGCASARPGRGGSMPGWRGCFREREARGPASASAFSSTLAAFCLIKVTRARCRNQRVDVGFDFVEKFKN